MNELGDAGTCSFYFRAQQPQLLKHLGERASSALLRIPEPRAGAGASRGPKRPRCHPARSWGWRRWRVLGRSSRCAGEAPGALQGARRDPLSLSGCACEEDGTLSDGALGSCARHCQAGEALSEFSFPQPDMLSTWPLPQPPPQAPLSPTSHPLCLPGSC